MSCLTNLGCLQIPTTTISTIGQQGPAGATGATGPAGPAGAAGAAGANGTTRLYNFVGSETSATPSSWETLKTYTLPANTLSSNGDSVLIQATNTCATGATSPPFSAAQRRITFGGAGNSTTILSPLEPFYLAANTSATARYITSVELIRTGATTATCRVVLNQDYLNPNIRYETQLTGLDFTVNNDIDFDVFQPIASQVALRTLTVDFFAI